MINSIGSTLSGLYSHNKKMAVSANNIANINTDGFKKSRAVIKEGTNGEVTVDIHKIETPGSLIHYREGEKVTQTESSNVDYSEEAVNMIIAHRGFEASLKALQAEEEMLGSLLDIKV